jgi:tetratricopeptide (TPR) repeat protein
MTPLPPDLGSALALHRAGRLDEAAAIYEGVLAASPDNGDALNLLGVVARQRGDLERSRELLSRATAALPRFPDAAYHLGLVLAALGDDSAALEQQRRAAALAPKRADILCETGRLLARQGWVDAAVDLYRQAVAADPAFALAGESLATLLSAMNCADEAAAVLRRLSAAAYDRRDLGTARRAAKAALALVPLQRLNDAPGAPRIALLSGVEHTFIAWRSETDLMLGGSHINTAGLFDLAAVTLDLAALGLADDAATLAGLGRPDLVINGIADADMEPNALARAESYVATCGAPVINRPARVLLTTRDAVWRVVKDIDGLVMGRTLRVACDRPETFDALVFMTEHGLRFPVLIRPAGTQTGDGLVRLDDEAGARALTLAERYRDMYVIQYVDCQSADGLYRKTRLILVDGEVFPDHHVMAPHWNSRLSNARPLMHKTPHLLQEEIDFLNDADALLGPARIAALRTLQQRLGLDYFGVDCNLLPDGRLLIFEANACMRRQYHEVAGGARYLVPHLDRVTAAFRALMARKLGQKGEQAPPP